MQGETGQCHSSNSQPMLPRDSTDSRHTLALPCRDTKQRSDSLCWGQIGRKNASAAFRQGAQRGIRLLQLRKHQSMAAHFKHSSLFLETCSTAECSTYEIHSPTPCVQGQVPSRQHCGSCGPTTMRHCVTPSGRSAPTPVTPLCMRCASGRHHQCFVGCHPATPPPQIT